MEQVCPNCGTARAERDFCFCAAPVAASDQPRPDERYSPPWRWHAIGLAAWLLTVGATIHANDSSAYVFGEYCGALIIPVGLRVVYVAVFRRGPQMWDRAFLSPWIWTIGIVMNVMAAGGNHPR